MKKQKLFGLLLLILTLSACEFNQSVNKDLTTGAYSRGNGIGCDEVKIQLNGIVENSNSFKYGEKVNFIFNNLTGLTKENGSRHVGSSLFVVNSENDTILHNPDLIGDNEIGADIIPLQLQAHFIPIWHFDENEEFKVFIKIWDKKGTGTFQYELPFTIEANNFLKIDNQEINYSSIYLWDDTEKLVVVNKDVKIENTLILILEGLDGLEVVNDKVYPSFTFEIVDNNGNLILGNANILEEYRNKGIDYSKFINNQLPVTMSFTPGQVNNPCQLKATLRDLNSDRKIDIECELMIR